jgi:3-phytase
MKSQSHRLSIATICFFALASSGASAISLRFIKDVNYPTSTEFENTKLGGLSGIYFDTAKNHLVAISDDKGDLGEDDFFAPRVYVFDVVLSEKQSTIVPTDVRPLKMQYREGKANESFPDLFLDPEGIALAADGSILISSEGRGPYLPPMIMRFSSGLFFEDRLDVPSRFIPLKADKGEEIKDLRGGGTQENAAFEALSFSPDKQVLFTGSEYGLKQDMPEADRRKTYFSRILTYRKSSTDLAADKEYLYPNENYYSGLSDFVALDGTTLLTLEREFTEEKKNIIKVFETKLDNATNVAGVEKITDLSLVTMAQKSLVLDLDSILGELDPTYPTLDNIEGIAIGPKLANGNDSLILVSDNNFSEKQRTVFLIFEIVRN